MLELRPDSTSGMPAQLQVVQQVKHDLIFEDAVPAHLRGGPRGGGRGRGGGVSWLAWRLHGPEVRFAGGVAAVAAALVVASRIVLSSGAGRDVKIWAAIPVFPVLFLVIVAPALLGMFLGAPLVATELEGGTYRLAWAQSVSRRRWLMVHVGLVLGGAVGAMAVAGAAMEWGLAPLIDLQVAAPTQAEASLQPGMFDAIAIVPAAYAAFAVALGVALGTFTRRTVVAMFLVLVLFTAVRAGIAAGVRPNYEPPLRTIASVSDKGSRGPSVPPGAYIVGSHVLDSAGRELDMGVGAVSCARAADCAGYRVATDYQPADRFWTFQLVEAGIYAALGALLLGLTYWRVVRRLT
jgi:hypothetical protein